MSESLIDVNIDIICTCIFSLCDARISRVWNGKIFANFAKNTGS